MDQTPSRPGTTYGVPARRKEISTRLGEAYSRDMLDQREFERRLERVEAASTLEELDALVADFPSEATAPATTSQRAFSVLSNQTHILTPGEQEGLKSFSLLGDVKVDLRAFRGSGKTVVLRVSGILGDVGIRVPPGTKIVRKVPVVLGEFRQVAAKKPGAVRQLWDRLFGTQELPPVSRFPSDGPPPTVVLEGFRFLGDITIEESLP